MVQAAPNPTIWGNKMMTKVSTWPISGNTEENKASKDSDTSTISSVHATVDRHDSLSLQEANHARKVNMDDNREDRGFNSSYDSGGHERKTTPKAERPNGEPNIQQYSKSFHRLEPEQDILLTVSSVCFFRSSGPS